MKLTTEEILAIAKTESSKVKKVEMQSLGDALFATITLEGGVKRCGGAKILNDTDTYKDLVILAIKDAIYGR